MKWVAYSRVGPFLKFHQLFNIGVSSYSHHINSNQKHLVSINAADLLLQIGCLQNLEQEEVAVLCENLEIP